MFDVERLMNVMSEILSDKYDVKITLKAVPKDQAPERDCAKKENKEEAA